MLLGPCVCCVVLKRLGRIQRCYVQDSVAAENCPKAYVCCAQVLAVCTLEKPAAQEMALNSVDSRIQRQQQAATRQLVIAKKVAADVL